MSHTGNVLKVCFESNRSEESRPADGVVWRRSVNLDEDRQSDPSQSIQAGGQFVKQKSSGSEDFAFWPSVVTKFLRLLN